MLGYGGRRRQRVASGAPHLLSESPLVVCIAEDILPQKAA